jgi:hypothetical protein
MVPTYGACAPNLVGLRLGATLWAVGYPLGKGEVESSILSGSTSIDTAPNTDISRVVLSRRDQAVALLRTVHAALIVIAPNCSFAFLIER